MRLGDSARTTKDIDLLALHEVQEIYPHLRAAGAIDLGDWFAFEVMDAISSDVADIGGMRYRVHALLDGRTFERFHVDVGISDQLLVPVDHLESPTLLSFAGIAPTRVPCYSITQQIAEKYHAYTRPHASGASSRVKDLVDILLLAGLGELDSINLQQAIQTTFAGRKTHELPQTVPLPSNDWSRPFMKLTNEVGLGFESLPDAGAAMQQFLAPILGNETQQKWNPAKWCWR